MIYINDNNIYKRCNILHTISNVFNNTEYLPVCTYNNILLMSDGQLYTVTRDNNLSALKLEQEDDYVVDPANFTDVFVKINSKCYEICGALLYKIPIVANNSHNIRRITRIHISGRRYYYYYYVNNNNELIVFDTFVKSYKILDNNVSLIIYHNYSKDCYNIIIYIKNNVIIYSCINTFIQLTYCHNNNHVDNLIIKSSGDFVLDSHNYLYKVIMNNKEVILKKISGDIINFYCDGTSCAYVIDTESHIHCISEYDYNKKYIDVGHFGKKISNTKSANNTL